MIKVYDEEFLKKDNNANCGRPYQQCSISVMDTIADPNISFDELGICNYYYEYKENEPKEVFKDEAAELKLNELLKKIKDAGQGKKYDCITGVSGGVDSTYLSYMAKEWGLRTLIVHFDNGWNSELAVKNIENIISKLGFDLYTLVVDWEEFRDIQLAYFKASVVDIEAISDHAIIATLYRLANKYDIKFVLSGTNYVTEATLPKYWIYNKIDHVNLKDIHKKHGRGKLKTYPLFNHKLKKISGIKGIQTVAPLNYIDYNKAKVKQEITEKVGWRDYGGKHFESLFTRFYQGYILPVKFNIDKRKAHLSNLIFSGQITKVEALAELSNEIYPAEVFTSDYEFVLKKLGLTHEFFQKWLEEPRNEHTAYRVEQSVWDRYILLKPFKVIRNSVKLK